MQQFVVPQFIDVESKIIGPLTVRQFLIFLLAAGLIFATFKIFSFAPAAVLTILIFAIAVVFAAVKINGRPFHYFIISLIQTSKRPPLKIWEKQLTQHERKRKDKEKTERTEIIVAKKPLTKSRLTELSLIVDTGGAFKEE